MKTEIGGYTYYDTKEKVEKLVKSDDDVVAYEAGLGWYIHSKSEYARNPRKRIFGF